jgi:hypothetical protein
MSESPPVQTAPVPDPRFAVPEALAEMSIGEFLIAELSSTAVRPTALNIEPPSKKSPYKYVAEMPIPYFLEHVRGWHLLLNPSCGSSPLVSISKALARFNIVWG